MKTLSIMSPIIKTVFVKQTWKLVGPGGKNTIWNGWQSKSVIENTLNGAGKPNDHDSS